MPKWTAVTIHQLNHKFNNYIRVDPIKQVHMIQKYHFEAQIIEILAIYLIKKIQINKQSFKVMAIILS